MLNKTNLLLMKLLGFLFIINSSLFAISNTQYEESINIPQYNANDSTHVLITENNGNWSATVLNDPTKQHFYIEPGNYEIGTHGTGTYITLSANGTQNERRTMSLYNGNDTHPTSLSDNQVANVYIQLTGDYWIIDRMAHLDRNINPSMRLMNGASHNIINRWHGRNMKYGLTIYPFSNFNTIQNSYFNQATHEGLIADCIGLALANANIQDTITRGTKIINNDFRNMTDGIQLVKSTYIANGNPSYPGTIIDNNRIWMDKDAYTDGNFSKDGYSHNSNSEYMVGENALDFKAASNEPNNPVLVTNNIMWGYRQADDTTVTNAGGAGTIISITRHSFNLKINNNILFDSQNGIGAVHFYYEGTEFTNNILYDIGKLNPPTSAYPNGRNPYALYVSASPDMQPPFLIKHNNNTFVKQHLNAITGGGRTISFHQNAEGDFLENNLFIDTQKMGGHIANHTRNNNWYYNHTGITLGGAETIKATAAEAKMADYTFEYDRFTTSVKSKTLVGVISTSNSPHYGVAGSNIGSNRHSNNSFLSALIAFIIF